jgi:hypothetical protein
LFNIPQSPALLKDQVIHRDNRVGNILNNVVVVVVVHVYFPRDGPEEKNKKREFVTRRFDECEMEFKQKKINKENCCAVCRIVDS